MDLSLLIDQLWQFAQDQWLGLLGSAIWLVVGFWWGRRRAVRDWKKKEFMDRLNVSLNLIEDGRLLIRTVLETSINEVMLNKVASEKVLDAARKTTEADPLLPVTEDDAWFLLNSVLNEIAERFSEGELMRDASQVDTRLPRPARVTYVICLTCEVAGDLRTRKVRAMMIRKDLLENLPAEQPELEHPRHATRWKTLNFMAAAYRQRPHQFLEVDLSFPVPGAGSHVDSLPAALPEAAQRQEAAAAQVNQHSVPGPGHTPA